MTYLYLILTTFFWAATFHLGKFAIQFLSPLSTAAWRFILAGVILAVITARQKSWDGLAVRQNLLPLIGMGVIGVFGFNAALFFGLKLTSPVNGALIMALNPSITALLSAAINRDAISPRQWLGFALGLAGVATVVSQGSLQTLLSLSFSMGDVLILLGCICWAMYAVIPKRFVKNLPTMSMTTSTIIIGATALAGMSLLVSDDLLTMPATPTVLAIVAMAVFGSVLAYIWWNQGIAKIGATRAAVFINLVPMFTALIGVALGQSISSGQIVGAALVISGVLIGSSQANQGSTHAVAKTTGAAPVVPIQSAIKPALNSRCKA